MPILEIQKGGSVQVDLFNRMLLHNNHKFQKAIETQNVSELQAIDENEQLQSGNSVDELTVELRENSVANKQQKVPVVNSFFPFSYSDDNDVDYSNLNEILLYNSMSEGSILDAEL